jgi:hypothetical protein
VRKPIGAMGCGPSATGSTPVPRLVHKITSVGSVGA